MKATSGLRDPTLSLIGLSHFVPTTAPLVLRAAQSPPLARIYTPHPESIRTIPDLPWKIRTIFREQNRHSYEFSEGLKFR